MKAETHHTPPALGDHVVRFYEHDPELARAVAGYLAGGLAAGAVAIVIATQDHRARFAGELAAAGIDLESVTRERALVMLDAEVTLARFTIAGRIDPGAFDHVIGGVVRGAASGGRPVRAYGEMVALLWDAGDVTGAIELEQLWNELRTQIEFSLLCGYRTTSVERQEGAGALRHVCELHTAVLSVDRPLEQTLDPAGETSMWIARDFPPAAESPGRARRFVAGALREWGLVGALRDDAELIVSELSTNAVVHGRCTFRVFAAIGHSRLRLSVQDSDEGQPAIRMAGPRAGLGLGLGLPTVDAVAGDWGVDHIPDGKIVWAELALPAKPGYASR